MIFNQWYLILESRELKRKKPLKVKRLNKTLAMWRDAEGTACCIEDRCCHRGASLSCGRVTGGEIQCPFHGFTFDRSGKVTSIPAIGKNQLPPEHMKVNAYKTFEAHGFIWIWYGEQEKIQGEPFFFKELGNYHHASFKDSWSVHYTRVIENNLDVFHLPFVHRTSIGSSKKTLVNGPFFERKGDLITFYGNNIKDDGNTIPLKPNSIPNYSNSHKLQFHFPNIWLVYTSKNTKILAAPAPVDDENTEVYIRYYQGWMKIPLIKQISTWTGKLITIIIARQDRKVVITQLPVKSDLKSDEKLIAGDLPIVEYRKHRAQLMNIEYRILNKEC